MSNPPQDPKAGKPPQDPKTEKQPAAPARPTTPPQSTPEAADAGGSRRHLRPFEKAHDNYMQRRQQLWRELQQSTSDASRSYAQAMTDMALDTQRHQQEAYRNYLEAARRPEEASGATLQAQQTYSGAMQEHLAASSLKSFDSYREKMGESTRAWEAYQRGCLDAYHQYLQEVQQAWSQADFKAIEAYSLSAISRSLLSVASDASKVTG